MAAAEIGNRTFVTDEHGQEEVEEFKEELRRMAHVKELLEEISAPGYTFTVANLKPEIATSSNHENRLVPSAGTHRSSTTRSQ